MYGVGCSVSTGQPVVEDVDFDEGSDTVVVHVRQPARGVRGLNTRSDNAPLGNPSAGPFSAIEAAPENREVTGSTPVPTTGKGQFRGHKWPAALSAPNVVPHTFPTGDLTGLDRLWTMLQTDALYTDPGDFYARRNPDRAKNRAVDQLRMRTPSHSSRWPPLVSCNLHIKSWTSTTVRSVVNCRASDVPHRTC
jgi:hypothetical protein